MIESPAGAVNAALTPLMKRVAMSSVASWASPPNPDATRNTASEIRNIRRRPSRSAARPQSTRRVPQARLVSLSACIGLLVRDPFGYCSTAIVHRLFDARQTMVETETFPSVLTVLEALADPVRLEIVRQVAGAEPGELMC